MTASPPDTETPDPTAPSAEAARLADLVGGEALPAHSIDKIGVSPEQWVSALTAAREEGLIFFSWLSAVDWVKEVAVGDPLVADEVDERIEVLCTVSDLSDGRMVTISTTLDHAEPRIATLTGVYAGADWHEREAAEMFGIVFEGHPQPEPLYLPDGFQGHPLRKSFRLLSREVKPWPGKVDVEGMPGGDDDDPSTENPEA